MFRQVIWRGAVIGAVAAIFVTIVLIVCGAIELNSPLAPVNCVSHILWGDVAFDRTEFSLKYTVAGLILNAAAIVMWGVLFEGFLYLTSMRLARAGANAAAVIITVAAFVVDYYIVPARLTPGFEARLSATALFVVYVSLALGLMIGDRIVRLMVRAAAAPRRGGAQPTGHTARQ
ncbi:MAG: hypothetical protein JNG88_05740 [Phycisphaerales bacterium]|nr:hypothetical protein [Phycisphaerales bacterium]